MMMKRRFLAVAASIATVAALSGCQWYRAPGAATPIDADGPITTYPTVGQGKVPTGTTPTGATGYSAATGAPNNGAIINGQAARCGQLNAGGGYDLACSQAAGLPGTASPYRASR